MVLLLAAAPLYYRHGYQDISHAKWDFYRNISLFVRLRINGSALYIPSFLPVLLCLAAIRKAVRKEKIHFSVTDLFAFGFSAAVIISAVLAPEKTGILYGMSGWYMGVFAQLSFVMLYFCVSRCYTEDKVVSAVILASSAAVIFVAVLNAFMIYPLSISKWASDYTRNLFMSTLGQPDWYSVWLMMFMAVGMFHFWNTDHKAVKMITAVYLVLCSMSCVTQNADTAVLVLAVLMLIMFAFCFDSRRHLLGYIDMTVLILSAVRFTGFLEDLIPEHVHKLEPLMVSASHAGMIIPAVIVLAAVRVFLGRKDIDNALRNKGKIIRRRVFTVYAVLTVCFMVYFVLNSMEVLPSWLWSSNGYLRFRDYWGNYRGFLYRITVSSMMMTLHSDPLRFFVGYGPDKYYRLVYQYYYNDIQKVYEGKRLVCAHNEFLNMAANTGVIGAAAYAGIFISVIVRSVKKFDQDPAVLTGLLVVSAYAVHGMLNFQQIIGAPVVFAVMGIAENRIRRIEKRCG